MLVCTFHMSCVVVFSKWTPCTRAPLLSVYSAAYYCRCSVPDVGDCPVSAPLPVLCIELESLTVCGTLMAHHVTNGGGVVVPSGVFTPVLEACTAAAIQLEVTR